MADPETPATPAPASASASASTKKKKKKKHSKKHASTDEAPTNVTIDASPASPAPADAAVDASTDEPAPAPADVAVEAPADEPPPTNVTVDASLGGSSDAGAGPVVGYFPSGYDPLAAAKGKESASSPRARLFRHEKHPTWVDLVVRGPGGGPDFVGRSYAGEAAAPQLCEYALGVLDRASGTLRVVPIAANKILRLEPHLEVQRPEHSEVASEAASAAGNNELKVQDLTMMYGTKMDRDKDNKYRSLNAQRNDPTAFEDIDLGVLETAANTIDSQEPVLTRNIPPHDPTADTSEKAYLLDEIIPKSMRQHLLEIISHFESGEFSSKGYGTFVSKRVHKLNELQGEDQERFAWILSYIQHLLTLLARNGSMSKRHRKDGNENQRNRGPATPQAVYRRLLQMFTEPGSSVMSTEKHELLTNYILVLTLFADDFKSDPNDICEDLKMTRQKLKPYYDQLGCKSVSQGAFKGAVMTLPAPLKFPKDVTRKRRRR